VALKAGEGGAGEALEGVALLAGSLWRWRGRVGSRGAAGQGLQFRGAGEAGVAPFGVPACRPFPY